MDVRGQYAGALEPYYDAARDRVRQDLLDYCHRDTLAMVRFVETLEGLAELLHDAADSG